MTPGLIWAFLAGCACGVACLACFVGVRWYFRPSALREECRRLQADLDEAHTLIGHLYVQLDRMAAAVGERRPARARKDVA
jgi:hypothetical protein